MGFTATKLELFQIWSYCIPFGRFFMLIDNLGRTKVLKSKVKKLLVIVSLVFHIGHSKQKLKRKVINTYHPKDSKEIFEISLYIYIYIHILLFVICYIREVSNFFINPLNLFAVPQRSVKIKNKDFH